MQVLSLGVGATENPPTRPGFCIRMLCGQLNPLALASEKRQETYAFGKDSRCAAGRGRSILEGGVQFNKISKSATLYQGNGGSQNTPDSGQFHSQTLKLTLFRVSGSADCGTHWPRSLRRTQQAAGRDS